MSKPFITGTTAFDGEVVTGGKTHVRVGRRSVRFAGKDTDNEYVRVLTTNSANTLLLAKGADGKIYAALAIEAKPGLLPDGSDSATLPARRYTLPSGRVVEIPPGHTVGVFGGYLEPSDPSTLKGAMREVLEEAGMDISGVKVLHAGKSLLKPAWSDMADSHYVAVASAKAEFGAMTGGDVSIAGRYWFTFDDAASLVLNREGGIGGEASSEPHGAHVPALVAMLAAVMFRYQGLLD